MSVPMRRCPGTAQSREGAWSYGVIGRINSRGLICTQTKVTHGELRELCFVHSSIRACVPVRRRRVSATCRGACSPRAGRRQSWSWPRQRRRLHACANPLRALAGCEKIRSTRVNAPKRTLPDPCQRKRTRSMDVLRPNRTRSSVASSVSGADRRGPARGKGGGGVRGRATGGGSNWKRAGVRRVDERWQGAQMEKWAVAGEGHTLVVVSFL